MTAAETLAAAKSAYEADRPLTNEEFQAIRDAQSDASTDPATRGALIELGKAISRQSDMRTLRAQAQAEVERGREHAAKMAARAARWRELPADSQREHVMAARYPHQPVTWRGLIEMRGMPVPSEPPHTFESELLDEHTRRFG